MKKLFLGVLTCWSVLAYAGNQQYEPLSASVQAALFDAVSDSRPQLSSFKDPLEATDWLSSMSERLEKRVPDRTYRLDLLRSVHYEATRAGLDPQMVLGLIEVESAFRKYAVSNAGARGYMQVMPFWLKVLERPNDNLFDMRTNLRYGCTILRHYIDIEKGDLFRALGRYNGSLGRAEYPNLVKRAWNKWLYANDFLPPKKISQIENEEEEAETAPPLPQQIAQAPVYIENYYAPTIIEKVEEKRIYTRPYRYYAPMRPPMPKRELTWDEKIRQNNQRMWDNSRAGILSSPQQLKSPVYPQSSPRRPPFESPLPYSPIPERHPRW